MSNKLYADMTPDEKAEIDRQEDSRESHKDALAASDAPVEPWDSSSTWGKPKAVPTAAQIEAIKAQITNLTAENNALVREEKELEDRMKAVRARRYAIVGDSHRYGEIKGARAKLAEAELLAADALLPKIRMRRKGSDSPWEMRIVAANGPKRGSLRTPGTDRCENIPSNYYEVHPDDRHMLRCYDVKVEIE